MFKGFCFFDNFIMVAFLQCLFDQRDFRGKEMEIMSFTLLLLITSSKEQLAAILAKEN